MENKLENETVNEIKNETKNETKNEIENETENECYDCATDSETDDEFEINFKTNNLETAETVEIVDYSKMSDEFIQSILLEIRDSQTSQGCSKAIQLKPKTEKQKTEKPKPEKSDMINNHLKKLGKRIETVIEDYMYDPFYIHIYSHFEPFPCEENDISSIINIYKEYVLKLYIRIRIKNTDAVLINHPYKRKYSYDNRLINIILEHSKLRCEAHSKGDRICISLKNYYICRLKITLHHTLYDHFYSILDYLHYGYEVKESKVLEYTHREIWGDLPTEIIREEYVRCITELCIKHKKRIEKPFIKEILRIKQPNQNILLCLNFPKNKKLD